MVAEHVLHYVHDWALLKVLAMLRAWQAEELCFVAHGVGAIIQLCAHALAVSRIPFELAKSYATAVQRIQHHFVVLVVLCCPG
jgi:hypothetical protein